MALRKLALILSLLLWSPLAAGEEPHSAPTLPEEALSVIEERLPLPKETRDSTTLSFELQGQRYSILNRPDANEMREVLVLAKDLDPFEAHDGMSEEEKAQFQKIRTNVLSQVVRALHVTRGAVSAGLATQEKVMALSAWALRRKWAIDVPRPYRTQQVIEGFLRVIDAALWARAPFLFQTNEFRLEAALGLEAVAGFRGKGVGGFAELGFSMGYNKESQTLVFEIFRKTDRFARGNLMPSLDLGMRARMGLGFVIDGENPLKEIRGSTRSYVGGFLYTDIAPEMYSVGLARRLHLNLWSGESKNQFERHRLIGVRVGIGPVIRPLAASFEFLRSKMEKHRARSCSRVFSA